MTLDLTDRQVEILLDCIRQNESQSRYGFCRRLSGKGSEWSPEVLAEKVRKFAEYLEEVKQIRAKLTGMTTVPNVT